MRELLTKGAAGGHLFFRCDDAYKTHAELKAKGVEITEEPVDQPYGIDFGLRDPFGNHIRIAPDEAGLRSLPGGGARRGRRHPCAGSAVRPCTVATGPDTPDRVGKGLWRSW